MPSTGRECPRAGSCRLQVYRAERGAGGSHAVSCKVRQGAAHVKRRAAGTPHKVFGNFFSDLNPSLAPNCPNGPGCRAARYLKPMQCGCVGRVLIQDACKDMQRTSFFRLGRLGTVGPSARLQLCSLRALRALAARVLAASAIPHPCVEAGEPGPFLQHVSLDF